MNPSLYTAFHLDKIMELIKPIGELGRYYKRNLPVWKQGQENELTKEYTRLKKLIDTIVEKPKFLEKLSSLLVNLPCLPETLKALHERPLLLHECFELKKFTHYTLQIESLLDKYNLISSYPLPDLRTFYAILDPDDLKSPTFHISPSYDTKLAKILNKLQNAQEKRKQLQTELINKAQKALKLNKPTSEIVVSRSQTDLIDKLTTSGFYEIVDENFANVTIKLSNSKDINNLNSQIATLENELAETEQAVLVKLSKKLALYSKQLNAAHKLLSQLDFDLAKAQFSLQYHCCIPKITKLLSLTIVQAVNIPVKLQQESKHHKFQPVDLRFTRPVNVLTGPNMGGKTTALITTGQLVWMMIHALPLPAEKAELCIFDDIWYNRETQETEGLSSFGKEIVSLTETLKKKSRQLIICDELAKGTNPTEGEAILTAILEYCNKLDCITVAATHFEQPAKLQIARQFAIAGISEKAISKLENSSAKDLNSQLDLLNNLMDYSLISLVGKNKPPRNAVIVAQVLGLPAEIVTRAKQLIG